MAIPVLIIGKSGTGKSASLRNFKNEEIEVINVLSKPLPFKNNFETYNTDNYRNVCEKIKDTQKKVICIDDAGYLITNQFMRGHTKSGGGNSIFQFYNELADSFWKLINFVVTNQSVGEDKIIYFIMHEEKNDFGDIKPKTIGKLLDEKVTVEGMFSIVLRSDLIDGSYRFHTQTDGMDVCKSPIGMFKERTIDNDLKMVDTTIRKYYKI